MMFSLKLCWAKQVSLWSLRLIPEKVAAEHSLKYPYHSPHGERAVRRREKNSASAKGYQQKMMRRLSADIHER